MAYGIKGDLNVLRRIFSRFIRIESLSGNTGNVLAADNNGEIVSRNVDFFLSGSTIFNDKVDSSTFYNYTSNTNTLIETKLNINDFNIYSSTTNNIINNNYNEFTSFTQSFNSYSSNTLNNINNNYNLFTSFTQSFNSYSSNTLNNINNNYNEFTSFTQSFNSYSSNTNTLIGTKLNISDFNIYSSTTNNIITNNNNLFTSFTQNFNSYSSNTLNNINNKYDKSGGTITGRAFLLSGITINNNIVVSGITGTNIIDGDTWLSAIVSKGVSVVGSQFPTNAPFLRASMRNDTPIDYGFIQSYSSVANGIIPIGFQPLRIEGKYIMFAGGNETLDGGVSSYIDDKGSLGINLLSSWVGNTTLPQRLPAKLYISASTSTPAMILDTTGGSNTLYVDSNGVGILTPPTQKLDVNGNLRLRGNLFDSLNTTGVTGYRLTTTPNGILWMSAETIPTNYDFIDFNTGYTATPQTGRVYFDTNENALSYFPSTPNMDVNLNIGQESLIRVYNNSGAQINNGSVTHISGSFNGLPTIVLANASDDNRSEIAGIATHNIPNNSIGFITFFGIVRDIDTSLFNYGDELYLSDTIDGGFTNNVLDINISSRVCSVGRVISTGVTDGKILVAITNENKVQSLTNKEVNILLGNTISTGLFEFTGLTITSTNTFKIPPVKGWFVNNTTNSTIPEVLQINYSGSTTGETTPYLTTNDTTFVLLTSAGTIQYQTTFPSPSERRLNIYLGKIVHPNRSSILTVNNTPDFDVSPMSSLRDLWSPIKMINQGIMVSPNGANLNINTTSGTLWGNGIGWVTNQLNPNSISIASQSPATFAYRTQTGGTSGNVTTIDVSNYDVNGIVTPISGSQYSTQRIYLFATGLIRIQYAQTTYSTLSKALAGLTTESFIENSNNRDNGILIGLLTVSSNATDLSNTNQAIFTQVSKFGEVLTGTAGGLSTTTLQQAYDNSSQPEILTNSTLGAVTFRRGSSSDSDSVIEVQSNSGTNTFRVNGLGNVSGNSLNLRSYLYDSTGLSGLTNQVLFTSPSGVVWGSIDGIVTGYTSSKLDAIIYTSFTNNFYSYSSNTNTLIGTKLNISDFNIYSSNTNTLIGTKLELTDFNTYSSTTKNILDNKVIELGLGVGSTLRISNNNLSSGNYSTVSGGRCNTVSNSYSVVGGGFINTITSVCSFVGGGRGNIISNVSSVIVGGYINTSSGQYSAIGGGYINNVLGNYSTVSGGYCNTASGGCSFIGGGFRNTSSGICSFVGGGSNNTSSGICSFVGGGFRNIASGTLSGILGGSGNTVSGSLSYILGGSGNTVSGPFSYVLGGRNSLNACSNSIVLGSNITATANDTTFTQSLIACGQTILQGTSASSGCALLVRNSTPLSLYTVLNTGQHIFDSSFTATANCSNGWLNCQTLIQRSTIGDTIVGSCLTPTIRSTNNNQTNKALSVIPLFTGSTLTLTGGTNIIAEFGATNVGTQLSVTDVTTGVIYGVNDISGLPIIDATSNWDVNIYDFPNTVFSKTGKTLTLGVIRNTASTITFQSDLIHNEGFGVNYRMTQVTGVTTGSTTAVLFQLPINTGQTIFLTTNTLGRANNATMDSTIGELKFTAKRSLTGSLTQVGVIQGFINRDNSNTNIGVDISSNNVRLLVTGNTDTYLWASTIIAQTY